MTSASHRGPAPVIWTLPPPPPRQRALGRDEIVRAATEVADAGGPAALTMGAVARRLGPYSPMALYRYVHSKDGLVDLMLDAAVAEVPVPDAPSGDWRADLHALATATWAMVTRHAWYAQLVHTRPPVGPHAMRRTEFALSVLVGQGVPVGTAMTYVALVDRHIVGNGLQEAEERQMRARHDVETYEKFLAALAPIRELTLREGRYPHLAEWMAAPVGPGIDEQFELGLTCLLDGIAARLPTRPAR